MCCKDVSYKIKIYIYIKFRRWCCCTFDIHCLVSSREGFPEEQSEGVLSSPKATKSHSSYFYLYVSSAMLCFSIRTVCGAIITSNREVGTGVNTICISITVWLQALSNDTLFHTIQTAIITLLPPVLPLSPPTPFPPRPIAKHLLQHWHRGTAKWRGGTFPEGGPGM